MEPHARACDDGRRAGVPRPRDHRPGGRPGEAEDVPAPVRPGDRGRRGRPLGPPRHPRGAGADRVRRAGRARRRGHPRLRPAVGLRAAAERRTRARRSPAGSASRRSASWRWGSRWRWSASTLSGFVNGWVAGRARGVPWSVPPWSGGRPTSRSAGAGATRARAASRGVVLGGGGASASIRVLTGAALVITGVAVFVFSSFSLDQVQFALVAVLAALVGVAVLTVPCWLRLVRDLGEERTARIRTEERAEIAAHLHDSVLQTLALIQKQAEPPREVSRLARGQERELRGWLYGPYGYGKSRRGRRQKPPPELSGASRRRAARWRTPSRSRSTTSWSATAERRTGCARWSRRPGRPWSTPPSTPRSARSASTPRSRHGR